MATANLAVLRTKIADMLARPEADIASAFTDAVETFEDKFVAEARLADMETSATISVVNGIAQLPSDFIELRNVVGPDGEESSGSYYLSGTQLVFGDGDNDEDDPAISQVTVLYYGKLPPLVNDGDTNWLLQKYPYLYRYGVLLEMAIWERDDAMLQRFEVLYAQAYMKVRSSDYGKRWGGSSVVLSGPTP